MQNIVTDLILILRKSVNVLHMFLNIGLPHFSYDGYLLQKISIHPAVRQL